MTGRRCRRRAALALGAVWVGLAADVVAQGSVARDRAALGAIYRATGGDNWTDTANWLSDAPLEDWYGVEVTDGRVTGLRLGRGWERECAEDRRQRVDRVASTRARHAVPSGAAGDQGNSGLTGPIPLRAGVVFVDGVIQMESRGSEGGRLITSRADPRHLTIPRPAGLPPPALRGVARRRGGDPPSGDAVDGPQGCARGVRHRSPGPRTRPLDP